MENNFLLVNKPVGWTSFDVVGFIRKKIRQQNPEIKKIKVGHAGTLDPFASGLLIIGVGREATKQLDSFKQLPKTYRALVKLGSVSTTDDKDGEIKEVYDKAAPEILEVEKVLEELTGKQEQLPPMFSAKKVGGTRLYKLARQGKEVERKKVTIEIYSLKLLKYEFPYLEVEVKSSAGTYIRTLAKSIGEKLGTGAYCHELTRTAIGDFSIQMAKNVDNLPSSLTKT